MYPVPTYFSIQQGSTWFTLARYLGAPILSIKGVIVTLIVFVYFENDIAEMAAGPPYTSNLLSARKR